MVDFGAGRRAVKLAKVVSIGGAKTAVDAVLNRDRALISFERLRDTRYHIYLLFALTRIGVVGCPARDANLAWTWLPARDFLRMVRINWRSPSDGILLSEKRCGPSILKIRPQYYSLPTAAHRLFVPYGAHPEFYRRGLHDVVRGMRGRERNVRIFFAGTLCRLSYSHEFKFPMLGRDMVLGHVISRFKWAITTEAGVNGLKPICIVTTSDTRDIVDKHKLSMRDYMDAMSRSDFFICPPGVRMPHSHNLIEAMSAGTIPITNYYSYMKPPLTPDGNCLAFSTFEELEKVIKCALCMPAAEIQRLREGVISYYDEHIETESFGKRLLERSASVSELVVNDSSSR